MEFALLNMHLWFALAASTPISASPLEQTLYSRPKRCNDVTLIDTRLWLFVMETKYARGWGLSVVGLLDLVSYCVAAFNHLFHA